MFENASVYAYVPVTDLDKGRDFYEGKLGFKSGFEVDGVGVTYECAGGTAFFMYLSDGAGTNKASTLFWTVGDVVATVGELKAADVEVIDYDTDGLKTHNGVATTPDGDTAAWFKDPFGNILAINQGA